MAFRPVTRYLAALLVLLALCCCGSASAAATAAQKDVTYNFLKGFNATFNAQLGTSWLGTDYCGWTGVSCDGDDYVTLNLASRGLTGYLPEANVGNESLIVSIDLSSNTGITGNFRDSWAALKGLKTLNLADTRLFGSIPDAWNGMVSLERVTITRTKACNGLPNWSGMPALTTIDLSNNNMGGTLASAWGSLVSLSSVKITGNKFCGCEPDTWKNVSVLHSAASPLAASNANCGTSNRCGSSSYDCSANNSGNGSMGLVSTVAAMLTVACALLSVAAL